ncbi:DUF3866 family protein [Desulfothermobacter acidiphilus]|uniref:DUF3866 family protein n=1 Tax=Desulfothermobacter acidiphilus TaxID=1938353 RepID=UPI003F88FC7B
MCKGGYLRLRPGKVLRVLDSRPGCQELLVEVEGEKEKALALEGFCGSAAPGDPVLLNTTAVALGLGSGGYHFVVANLNHPVLEPSEPGHIMKLRYTPAQLKVLAVEEPESPYHPIMREATSLEGTPVVALELHSQLAAVAAALWQASGGRVRVVYVMTDGGALPLVFSRTVAELRHRGLLASTVTVGHAFGGELEAVTLHSGLLAARHVAGADVIVAGMGPGVVGTSTPLGTTAVGQGEIVNAAGVLDGRVVIPLRLSFADLRARHQGISHHTLTVLQRVSLVSGWVPLPRLSPSREALVWEQLEAAGVPRRHRVLSLEAESALMALKAMALQVTTMGRGAEEEPEFFLAAGAAGLWAWHLLHLA